MTKDNSPQLISSLNPLFELMRNIVITHEALTNTATTSFTTNVDPRYLAAEEALRNATAEHAANEELITTLIASVDSAKQAARTRQQDGDRGGANLLMQSNLAALFSQTHNGGTVTTPQDNIFTGIESVSAYATLPEYLTLKWPDNDARSNLMARTQVHSLRMGFVITVLHFTGMESFATLAAPDAYYVVIAEYPDNSTRLLSLANKNPAYLTVMPPCLTFEARVTPYSVVTIPWRTLLSAQTSGNRIYSPHYAR